MLAEAVQVCEDRDRSSRSGAENTHDSAYRTVCAGAGVLVVPSRGIAR